MRNINVFLSLIYLTSCSQDDLEKIHAKCMTRAMEIFRSDIIRDNTGKIIKNPDGISSNYVKYCMISEGYALSDKESSACRSTNPKNSNDNPSCYYKK